MEPASLVPLWLKLAVTAYVAVTFAVYAVHYPPANFLWFSDIALALTVPALWLESALLASMIAIGILLPEAVWNAGFFWQLATGKRLTGLTDYMFDPRKPRYLRALSLFHVFLPPLALWLVARLGYDPAALPAQTLLAWIVLALCYFRTDPAENVNWVFGPGGRPQTRLPPLAYLALLMPGFPLLVYLPAHWMLAWLFG
jgi:hypothetical protein